MQNLEFLYFVLLLVGHLPFSNGHLDGSNSGDTEEIFVVGSLSVAVIFLISVISFTLIMNCRDCRQ